MTDLPPRPDPSTPEGLRTWIAGHVWGPVPEEAAIQHLLKFMELLYQENNVLLIPSPIYIVGDIHGQLDDLLYLFSKANALPIDGSNSDPSRIQTRDQYCRPLPFDQTKHFLFMGDYVDRGYHSLHTFLYLCSLKIEYPQSIYLLRGNHESRQISHRYGFYQECILNYGHAGLWTLCAEAFDLLPLAALINQDIFCVHGGLSPKLPMIERVSLLDRQVEVPQSGPITDICWSDPENVTVWRENTRGAGYLFGPSETTKFTRVNRLDFVARSHQIAMDGFTEYFAGPEPERTFRLITVWSAPNYSYRSGNMAAIMGIDIPGKPRKELVIFGPAPDQLRITPPEEERPAGPSYFS